jgi:hypothetical protein
MKLNTRLIVTDYIYPGDNSIVKKHIEETPNTMNGQIQLITNWKPLIYSKLNLFNSLPPSRLSFINSTLKLQRKG